MKIVHMVQLTPHRWQIENQDGIVIMPDITAHNISEATQYVINYVSSFRTWEYIILPLNAEIVTIVTKYK